MTSTIADKKKVSNTESDLPANCSPPSLDDDGDADNQPCGGGVDAGVAGNQEGDGPKQGTGRAEDVGSHAAFPHYIPAAKKYCEQQHREGGA